MSVAVGTPAPQKTSGTASFVIRHLAGHISAKTTSGWEVDLRADAPRRGSDLAESQGRIRIDAERIAPIAVSNAVSSAAPKFDSAPDFLCPTIERRCFRALLVEQEFETRVTRDDFRD